MVIIGIDPSLSNTAVAIGNGVGEPQVRCFPSSPRGAGPMERIGRCAEVAGEVCGWVGSRGFLGPCHFFIEGYSQGSKFNREVLAEMHAILYHWIGDLFYSENTTVYEVQPTCLKKFVTGKGSSQKEEMRLGAYKYWGVEFKTNDEVDAYGLYRFGLCVAGLAQASNAAQREAVDALLTPKAKNTRKKRQAQS